MAERRTIGEGVEIEKIEKNEELEEGDYWVYHIIPMCNEDAWESVDGLVGDALWNAADPARLREAQARAVEAFAKWMPEHDGRRQDALDYAASIRGGEVAP